jgi:hypothetical protein
LKGRLMDHNIFIVVVKSVLCIEAFLAKLISGNELFRKVYRIVAEVEPEEGG